MAETCDMIWATDDGGLKRCDRPAAARTIGRPSVITDTGHVRYCAGCLENIAKHWGVKTEPWPPEEPCAPAP